MPNNPIELTPRLSLEELQNLSEKSLRRIVLEIMAYCAMLGNTTAAKVLLEHVKTEAEQLQELNNALKQMTWPPEEDNPDLATLG